MVLQETMTSNIFPRSFISQYNQTQPQPQPFLTSPIAGGLAATPMGTVGVPPPKKMSLTTYFIIFLILVILGFVIYVIVMNTKGGSGSSVTTPVPSNAVGSAGSTGIAGVVAGGLGVGTLTQGPITSMPVNFANDVALPPDPNGVPSVLPATIKPVTISIDANQLAVLSAPSTPPPPPPTNATYTGDTWTSGQIINLGDRITTQDKSYSAAVTTTGDLQVYNATGQVVWSAYTNDTARIGAAGLPGGVWVPTGVTFQSTDGNFIVNGSIGGRVSRQGWACGSSSGPAPYRMVISPNGHLYCYDANNVSYWQTGAS